MSRFKAILDEFRALESAGDLLPIARSEALLSTIVAWRKVGPTVLDLEDRRVRDLRGPPRDVAGRWAWLWDHVAVPRQELAEALGVGKQEVDSRMAQLIRLRAIYPDGSAHANAGALIEGLLALAVERAHKRFNG